MPYSKKFLAFSIPLVLLGLYFGYPKLTSLSKKNADPNTQEAGDASGTEPDEGSTAQKSSKAMNSLNEKFSTETAPITVHAKPAFRGELVQNIKAQGRVYAYQNIEIFSEISGKITKLDLRDGMTVTKGRILAQIDDREYNLAFEDAQARLLKAKADFVVENYGTQTPNGSTATEKKGAETTLQLLKQLQQRFEAGEISEMDYRHQKLKLELEDIQKGNRRNEVLSARVLDSARIEVEKARLNLEKTVIRAPFDGTLFELSVSEGQFVSGSSKLVRLVNLKNMVIKAQVLESEMGQITQGRQALVSFTALPELEPIQGKVQAISPQINVDTKTCETIISFANPSNQIRPGMFADVIIHTRIYQDRLLVPKTAILPRDNRKVVFAVNDGRAKWIYVETGLENDTLVEITEGEIAEGDMVLIDNHFTMGHDTPVKIADSE